MVVIDADDRPLRAAKLWNDTESAEDADALVAALGAPSWATACGSVPVAAFTITKLAWLRRVEPEVHAAIDQVLLPHDWLTGRWTADRTTDRGDASGTGYWSPASGDWREDLLAMVDLGVQHVPRVLGPLEAAGERDGAVIAPGTGDNMAAALGLGLRPGDVAVSIGTSGTTFAVAPAPTADPSGAVAGFADATGRFLPLVCTLNATKVSDAVARLLGVDHTQLDALALASAPGAGGVCVVPYFDGERTPNLPHASGSIAGMRSDISREQLARAAFEGVICGLLDGLDALRAVAVDVGGRVFLAGGGAQSAAYRSVLADLIGRPVIVAAEPEPVALGACVQAAAVLHQRAADDVAAAWDVGIGQVVDPTAGVDAAAIRAQYRAAAADP
jgi:xylulokinase